MYNCRTPFLSAVSEVFVINSNSGVRLNKMLPSDFREKKTKKVYMLHVKTHDKDHVRCRYCVGVGGATAELQKKNLTFELN